MNSINDYMNNIKKSNNLLNQIPLIMDINMNHNH